MNRYGYEPLITRLQALAEGIKITVLSLGIGILAGYMSPAIMPNSTPPTVTFFVQFAMMYVGTGGVTLAYVAHTRGLGFIDIVPLERTTPIYIAIGIITVSLVTIGFNLIVSYVNIHPATSGLKRHILTQPEMVAAFVGLIFVLNAPVEELLFRNVVQKTLTEHFHPASSITLASGIFATLHIPNYLSLSNPAITPMVLISTGTVFVTAVIFGTVYWITDNLLTSIFVHAFYNVLQVSIVLLN